MSAQTRVLVVGGGLGIGEAAVHRLVKKHNAKVVVLSLHVSPDIEKLASEGKVSVVLGDATKSDVRERAKQVVLDYLGGLDSLLITMGVLGETQRVGKMDFDRLRTSFEINVFTPWQLVQDYLPSLRATKGRITILSSTADRETYRAGWSTYCASKAALTRFIEVLGHEEEENGVEVQGLYPGLTRTPMITDLIAGKFSGIMKDEEVQFFIEEDKAGRIEPPEWTGNVAADLAALVLKGKGHGESQWYYDINPNFAQE